VYLAEGDINGKFDAILAPSIEFCSYSHKPYTGVGVIGDTVLSMKRPNPIRYQDLYFFTQ
jgi:hypothetical protein